jgi:hypothetical protein
MCRACCVHSCINHKAYLVESWTARWSHGRFLGWVSKPRSSRDYVGAESWVEIGGGYTEFAGFAVVHQKTTGFLGWAIKPRPKTQRGGVAIQAGSTAQEGRSDSWAGQIAKAGLTAQGGGLTALVAGVEMLRSRGCGCRTSVWWRKSEDFRIRPWGACIPSC